MVVGAICDLKLQSVSHWCLLLILYITVNHVVLEKLPVAYIVSHFTDINTSAIMLYCIGIHWHQYLCHYALLYWNVIILHANFSCNHCSTPRPDTACPALSSFLHFCIINICIIVAICMCSYYFCLSLPYICGDMTTTL